MKSLVHFIALLIPFFSFSMHNGSLEGIIYDAASKTELSGVKVTVAETGATTYTNDLGYFAFQGLPEGVYQISASFIGFSSQSQANIQVRDEESTQVKIFLQPATLNLPEVEVHSDASLNLSTIGLIDIQTRPTANAQEVLRIVPGLFIAQHAGGGKAEQIFLRGFDIDHGTDINLSVDGMPVNMVSHAHGQGYADLHFVIPEIIERVDYQKGPYYANLGDFSTAGSVQFRTVNALDRSFVKLEAGQFDAFRLASGINLVNNTRQRAFAAVDLAFMNGYFDSPQQFKRINIWAKYNALVSDDQILTLTFSTFRSNWNASGQIPERAVQSGLINRFGAIDDTEGGETGRTNLNLVYLKNINSSTFTRQQVYYSKYDFELYSNFTFFSRDPVNGDQIRQKEERQITGYNGSLHNTRLLGQMPLESEFGLTIRYDDIRNDELSYTRNRIETLGRAALGNVEEANAGLYYNGTLRLTDALSLNAGLRFDQFYFRYDNLLDSLYQPGVAYANLVSPKLSLSWKATDNLQFFIHSGTGFHSNDARVVVAQGGKEILPRAYGLEGGLVVKPVESLLLQAAFWRLDLDQEFVYVGDEGIVEPSGRTQRMGVDVSARLQLADWALLDLDVNYSHARAKDEPEGEDFIPLAPALTSTGGLQLGKAKGLGGSLRYRFIADRPANEDESLTAEGYFLLDAVAHYRTSAFELGVQVQNLLNSEWKEAQFATTSRLFNEPEDVTEIHYTPGAPFFVKAYCILSF